MTTGVQVWANRSTARRAGQSAMKSPKGGNSTGCGSTRASLPDPKRTGWYLTDSLASEAHFYGGRVMRMGIFGAGAMAEALGSGWVKAGHEVMVGGRTPAKAAELASRIGAVDGGLREVAGFGQV